MYEIEVIINSSYRLQLDNLQTCAHTVYAIYMYRHIHLFFQSAASKYISECSTVKQAYNEVPGMGNFTSL